MKRALGSGLTLAIFLASACLLRAQQPGAGKAAPEAKAMKDDTVDVSKFRFQSPDCERRFKAIRAYFTEKAQGAGWDHIPIRKLGNFLEESWCFPPEPGWNCFSNYAREKKGTIWYEVSTLYYDKDWPAVFGLNVSAGNNTREGDWGIHLFYSEQGEHIVGSGLGVDFLKFDGEGIKTQVHLGTGFDYQAEATPIRVSAPGDLNTELRLLYASEASFKETALARCDALRAEVEKAFKEHRVQKRVYGPYKGRGIPPLHEDVALSADEEKVALDKARQELGDRRQAVEQNYQLFYQLLVSLLPYDRCWK